MTKLRVVCLALLVFTACVPAMADEPLPPDVVARVGGRDLTFDGFCLAAAQQKLPQLKQPGSNATTILRGLVEENIVRLEARRLGVRVTDADIQARWNELERDVRQKYRGQKTLRDLMRDEGTNEVEFRDAIRHQLLKDKIAAHPSHLGAAIPRDPGARLIQIEIVIGKIVDAAGKSFDVAVPPNLFKNIQAVEAFPDRTWIAVVRVGNETAPITMQDFGRALVKRMSSGDVHEMLDREVKTGLLAMQGYKLSDAEFDDEVGIQRKHWNVQRTLTSQEALSDISYDDWIEAKYKMTVDEMKRKRYWRGYLALVRRLRDKVTAEEVRAEYEKKKDTHWGDYILVTEIQIEFKPDNARFTRPGLRTHRDALKEARDVPRRLAAGEPFDQVVNTINSRRDPTYRAQRRRLRPNTDDAKLWERAVVMKDKDLSSPFETLTHVHLIRRESKSAAPAYSVIAPVVRESIARRKAREWLSDQIDDKAIVQLRWPLPQRGEVGTGLRRK